MWDAASSTIKRAHPNSLPFNKIVSEFYSKIQNEAYKLVNDNNFTFDNLKLSLGNENIAPKQIKQTSFKDFGDNIVNAMLEINKAGNAIVYRTAINKILAYANNSDLLFTDITYSFLDGFRNSLLKSGLKANSISNYFRTLSGDSDEPDHLIPGQADHQFRGKLTRGFRDKLTTLDV